MQLVTMIDRLSVNAKRRFFRMLPVLAEVLDGTSGEFNRRFVSLLAAIIPILRSSTADGEKRIIELVRRAALCDSNDQYRLIDFASRLAPPVAPPDPD